MKYVRIVCYSAIAISLCGPASAGNGNALAGGWDGTFGGGSRSPAAANASAHAGASASTSFFSLGVFASPALTFGSGGGSSGNTGGAPAPEVNATLSLLLVGGTVAFLRRRRAGKAKPQV